MDEDTINLIVEALTRQAEALEANTAALEALMRGNERIEAKLEQLATTDQVYELIRDHTGASETRIIEALEQNLRRPSGHAELLRQVLEKDARWEGDVRQIARVYGVRYDDDDSFDTVKLALAKALAALPPEEEAEEHFGPRPVVPPPFRTPPPSPHDRGAHVAAPMTRSHVDAPAADPNDRGAAFRG